MDVIDVCDSLSQDFIDYAYEANVNRGFPDARDGLKPGQRACLWGMYAKGHVHDKPHVKSAKISGFVCGELWPHGDTAIYDTFVRMSQPWINNFPEVEFHGSNGNQIIGPDAAASRYTEARLSKLVEDYMMDGIKRDAVDMVPNYSEDQMWPSVLPSVFPRLLVNGSKGIGVGIAQEFIPRNMGEVIDVIKGYIDNGRIKHPCYPDFPSGGVIVNESDLAKIDKTGKGKVVLEAYAEFSKNEINVTELCYQTYVEPIINEIKDGIEKGKIFGVKDVINKSDKNRLLLNVICDRSADPQKVWENLLANTSLRCQYNANQIAIVGKTPKLLNLKDMCEIYVSHNLECIRRTAKHDYAKSLERCSVLSGFMFAVTHIDDVVAAIRSSKNRSEAKTRLASMGLHEDQAEAILDMKLSRLTNMEKIALDEEYAQEKSRCLYFKNLSENEVEQKNELLRKLDKMAREYPSKRKTRVVQKDMNAAKEAAKDDTQYSYSWEDNGYVTKKLARKDDKDVAADHEGIILVMSDGKVYRLLGSDFSTEKRTNVLGLLENAKEPLRVLATRSNPKDFFIVTRMGYIKRISTSEFDGNVRNLAGMPSIGLKDGDSVVEVFLLDRGQFGMIKYGNKPGTHIYVHTEQNMGILFPADDVPLKKKAANGVICMKLKEGDHVQRVAWGSEHFATGASPQHRGGKGQYHPTMYTTASVC